METVIYQIENLINGDCYIGSSNNFHRRKRRHFEDLKKGVHHSIILQRAFNKYGEASFRIFKIESFPFISKELTIAREQYYLDLIKPKYNVCLIAGSQLGAKRSLEFKQKCSERMLGKEPWNKGLKLPKQSEETKNKRALANTGKKRSQESKLKMREKALGRVFTEEHKNNLSKAKRKK